MQALFISDKKYFDAGLTGGVQRCTQEYLMYLKHAGLNVTPFLIEPSLTIKNRIKIKLGIEVYERYDIKGYLEPLINQINTLKIKLVLFNQVNLAGWAAKLRPHLSADIKFVALSHGNESGDFLHESASANQSGIINTWRLGKLLVTESQVFSQHLNGIIVLSKNDLYVNQWLGADKQFYLPRLLSPQFISRQPVDKRMGFVGTLDHLPNRRGLEYLLNELKRRRLNYKIRLVGAPAGIGHEIAAQYAFVEYVGALSEPDLIAEMQTWSVFLNPVFWYSRGASTKLAFAINYGVPVITTPAGKRGYELYSDYIISADNTPKTFVDKILNVLESKADLEQLERATKDNANNFDLAFWADKLRAFLNNL